eukprot:1910127-Alexandrium_andersonii.AAC.1
MSASLVGSEMCIRDRFRQRPQRHGQHGINNSAWPCRPSPQPERGHEHQACLLYTSDAADDM